MFSRGVCKKSIWKVVSSQDIFCIVQLLYFACLWRFTNKGFRIEKNLINELLKWVTVISFCIFLHSLLSCFIMSYLFVFLFRISQLQPTMYGNGYDIKLSNRNIFTNFVFNYVCRVSFRNVALNIFWKKKKTSSILLCGKSIIN